LIITITGIFINPGKQIKYKKSKMNYSSDKRIVATLDAGGTKFIFSAIQGNREIIEPIRYSTDPDNLEKCLTTLKQGFREVINTLPEKPVAISFAFPGPADYTNGIIGDLPNFTSFRGGVALGPMLEAEFGIPVFINNDGSLFAYGEAIAGVLPEINEMLNQYGSIRQFKNLVGVTLGTGFGGGAVVNRELLVGDNGCGGDVWVFRNKKYPNCITEESVSIRAVRRVYSELSGDNNEYTPKDIFDIAEGIKKGNQSAAINSFEELGEMAGDTIAHAITTIDGLVVIGGGLAGAGKYIVPAIVKELNGSISTLDGKSFPRLQAKAYDLNDKDQLSIFLKGSPVEISIPGTTKMIPYESEKKIGIVLSKLGTDIAIAVGAYSFALHSIDKKEIL
jgi:glucokinase